MSYGSHRASNIHATHVFISLHLTKTDKTKLPHNYWRREWRLNI